MLKFERGSWISYKELKLCSDRRYPEEGSLSDWEPVENIGPLKCQCILLSAAPGLAVLCSQLLLVQFQPSSVQLHRPSTTKRGTMATVPGDNWLVC